jgi:hypothetical protein
MLCGKSRIPTIDFGSIPNVVEKGIGIYDPIGKPNKNKGGYADGERIPTRDIN